MNALVESDLVDRALCITGDADVFARINDVQWGELRDRLLNRLQRIPGVVRSSTSFVVPTASVARGVSPKFPVFHRIADAGIDGLVFVGVAAGSAREVVRSIRTMKGVLGLAVVTGEYDLIVQVQGRSIEQLATTVLQEIQTIPGVTSTSTSLILAATPLREAKRRSRKPAARKTRKPARRRRR
jgi:DNA-binding Lrp family transcriptional regulator